MTEEAQGAPIEQTPQTPNPVETSSPAATPEDTTVGKPPTGEQRKSLDEIIKSANAKAKQASESEAKPKAEPKDDVKAKTPEPKADPKPKADAKPDAKPEAKTPDTAAPERGEDGKFKSTKAPEPDRSQTGAEPRKTAHPEAPQRFDDAAKAAWEGVDENVRGATHRVIRELESGIQKYKGDAEAFESVRKYADMAKNSGTDLAAALDRYTRVEQELRNDPIAGLQAVVANLGLKGPNGQPATLRDVAAWVLGQKPDQVASRQDATISSLKSEVADLKAQLGQFNESMEQQRQQSHAASVQTEWDNFQRENPNAVTLEPQIAEFLTKYPAADNISVRDRLSDALAWAEARNPDKVAAHTRDIDVGAQTPEPPKANPAGQKSISGAPASGSDPTLPAKTKGQNVSIEDSIKRAAARLAS